MPEKYISQKSQKIVSALYLITDFIKDNDVIKWEIREEGIALVSSALLLSTNYPVEKEHAIKSFSLSSEKIISFLNICQSTFLISKMNHLIVVDELESLVNYIKKYSIEIHPPGYILSDTFFATDNIAESSIKDNKGHKDFSSLKSHSREAQVQLQVKKSNTQEDREREIVALLKKDSNLTIKDFAKVIKNCSEKTIQRELISLVKKGVVKRLGERRWSTYSLK